MIEDGWTWDGGKSLVYLHLIKDLQEERWKKLRKERSRRGKERMNQT